MEARISRNCESMTSSLRHTHQPNADSRSSKRSMERAGDTKRFDSRRIRGVDKDRLAALLQYGKSCSVDHGSSAGWVTTPQSLAALHPAGHRSTGPAHCVRRGCTAIPRWVAALIDAISSWWVTLHGHGHPVMAAAIAEQAHRLEQVIFADFTHEPAEQLAERLSRIWDWSVCSFQITAPWRWKWP